MRRIFVVSVLIAFAAVGCGNSGGSVDEANRSIMLKVGERATIRLAANLSTPYRWVIAAPPDPGVARVVSEDYESDPNPQGKSGVGGTQLYVVEGVGKGATTMDLGNQYVVNDSVSARVSYTITVR